MYGVSAGIGMVKDLVPYQTRRAYSWLLCGKRVLHGAIHDRCCSASCCEMLEMWSCGARGSDHEREDSSLMSCSGERA